MFLASMLGGGLLGVAIERFAYRRLRDAPRIAPLITALGVSFFLENAALLLLGADYRSYNTSAGTTACSGRTGSRSRPASTSRWRRSSSSSARSS